MRPGVLEAAGRHAVGVSLEAAVRPAAVSRIVEELLVVRADVERHRQHAVTGGGRRRESSTLGRPEAGCGGRGERPSCWGGATGCVGAA